jgi:hypothetical protein
MNHRKVGNAMLTLALVAGLLLAVGPAVAQAQGGGWEWMNPLPTGDPLYGVWGSSGSDVFAVGELGTILHYDGTAWSTMSSGTTEQLYGVWGSSGSDVFAVGLHGSILHYDGTGWSAMSSGTGEHLSRVWGSSGSDVFAVGVGIILHGAAWSAMSSSMADDLPPKWWTPRRAKLVYNTTIGGKLCEN